MAKVSRCASRSLPQRHDVGAAIAVDVGNPQMVCRSGSGAGSVLSTPSGSKRRRLPRWPEAPKGAELRRTVTSAGVAMRAIRSSRPSPSKSAAPYSPPDGKTRDAERKCCRRYRQRTSSRPGGSETACGRCRGTSRNERVVGRGDKTGVDGRARSRWASRAGRASSGGRCSADRIEDVGQAIDIEIHRKEWLGVDAATPVSTHGRSSRWRRPGSRWWSDAGNSSRAHSCTLARRSRPEDGRRAYRREYDLIGAVAPTACIVIVSSWFGSRTRLPAR